MRRLPGLLALLFAVPLLAQPWPVSQPQLGAARGRRSHPRIAAAATTFFAAWTDFRFSFDVWGTRFDANGHAIGSVHVAADAELLDLASDGDGYLAVVEPKDCGGIDAVHINGDGVVDASAHIADVLACPLVATVASNGDSYLVVYSGFDEKRTRYALYDRGGKRIRGPLPMEIPNRGALAAASNGRDYLLVAGSGSGVLGYGIAANGDLGAAKTIDTAGAPDLGLASNGASYLLLMNGAPLRTRALAADGTPTGALHTTLIPENFNARLTWTGSEYLASWTIFYMPFTTNLMVSHVAADGAFVGTPATTASSPSYYDPFDSASAHGITLMVHNSGDQMYASTISAADVDVGLIPAGDLISLSAAPQSRPRMAAIPGGAVVTWLEEGHLYARLVDGAGKPFGAIVEAGFANSIEHHVGFDGDNIVVATLQLNHKLYAQRFTTSLQPVDPQPISVGFDGGNDFAMASSGGTTIFAWSDGKLWASLLRSGQFVPQHVIASDNDANPPAATWDGYAFLVAYSTGTTLTAVRVNTDGTAYNDTKLIAELSSPAVRSAIAPARGGVFGAWSTYGFGARIFGAISDLAGTATPTALSPNGVVEGPFVAGDNVVAWTLRVDGGLQLQWRAFADADVTALPPQPRLAALQPSVVTIGNAVVAAITHFDEAAGGVPRVYVHPPALPRHRAVPRAQGAGRGVQMAASLPVPSARETAPPRDNHLRPVLCALRPLVR